MPTSKTPPALALAHWASDSSNEGNNQGSAMTSLSSNTSYNGRQLGYSSSPSSSSSSSSSTASHGSSSSATTDSTSSESGGEKLPRLDLPTHSSESEDDKDGRAVSGDKDDSASSPNMLHSSTASTTSTASTASGGGSGECSEGADTKARDHVVVHVTSPHPKAKGSAVTLSDETEKKRQEEEEEQEVPLCRICWDTDGTLIRPCGCKGTQEFVHLDCIKKWESAQLSNPSFVRGICPTCKGNYDRGIVPAQITERIREVTTNNKSVRYLFCIIAGMALALGVVVPSVLLAYPRSDMYQRSNGSKTSLYWLFYLSSVIGWTAQCVVLVVVQGYTRTATFLRAPPPRQFLIFSVASFYLPVYLCLFFASLLMESGHSQWSLYARMLGMGGVAWILVGISHIIMYSFFQCCRYLYYWSRRRQARNATGTTQA